LLNGYGNQLQSQPAPPIAAPSSIRGLVSPHIDYARGGPVYAQVWQQAAEAVRAVDLAVILGTDHYGGEGAITLTRQHYATPYGQLTTERDVVDALVKVLGKETAFLEELHHRTEHSIELAAVWLHHMRGGEPCDTVPILCGSFRHHIEGRAPANDTAIDSLVDAFWRAAQGRRVLIVAAADLAHVGPAFGGRPIDMLGRAQLQATDRDLIDQVCSGDAEGFLDQARQTLDRNNVCGIPPLYIALRLLQADRRYSSVQGDLVAYDRCPADEQSTSLVSICGIVFS
jgi:AmmeMemoRadiSam system protein B